MTGIASTTTSGRNLTTTLLHRRSWIGSNVDRLYKITSLRAASTSLLHLVKKSIAQNGIAINQALAAMPRAQSVGKAGPTVLEAIDSFNDQVKHQKTLAARLHGCIAPFSKVQRARSEKDLRCGKAHGHARGATWGDGPGG